MVEDFNESGPGDAPTATPPAALAGARRMKFRAGARQSPAPEAGASPSAESSAPLSLPTQAPVAEHGVAPGAEPIPFGDALPNDFDAAVMDRLPATLGAHATPGVEAHGDAETVFDTVFSSVFDDTRGAPSDRKNKLVKKSESAPSKDRASFSSPAPTAPTAPTVPSGAPKPADEFEGPDIVPASEPHRVPASDTSIPAETDARLTSPPAGQLPPAAQVIRAPLFPGLRGLLSKSWGALDGWVGSAAGYDEKILESFGTPSDEKRRRNIGRAIVVATLVGSLGWLVKISLALPAPYGIVVGLTISGLYGVLSYSLESFFAANVDPFAPLWSKCLSLLGRSLLSALIAFSGALPWVTMSLKGPIQLEMAKLTQSEQMAMRGNIDQIHGLTGLGVRSTALQSELAQWNDSLANLPASIAAGLAQADQCETQLDVLKQDAPRREAELTSRLGLLSRLEAGANGDARKIAALGNERRTIARRVLELNQSVSNKKAQCTDLRANANGARDGHVSMATTQRASAMGRLAQQRETEQTQLAVAQKDTAQADQATKLALSENSAGEFTALASLLRTQLYAQFLGGLIFLGLFMVDVLPLTLRLFARPGPYDGEKRADDAIRMMRAEGRLMQAELIHTARRVEITSEDFRSQVQKEVRPHIHAIALNDVARFVAKQRNSA